METFRYSPHHSQEFWQNLLQIDNPACQLKDLKLSPKNELNCDEVERIRQDFVAARAYRGFSNNPYHALLLDFGLAYLDRQSTPSEMVSVLSRMLHRLKEVNMLDTNLAAILFNNRAAKYDRMNQKQSAIEDYTRAIEIAKTYSIFYSNRANTYDDLGQTELALIDYTKAIECDPSSTTPYFSRAAIYYKQGKYQVSEQDFSKILTLDPTNNFAYIQRCCVYQVLQKLVPALADLDRATMEQKTSRDESWKTSLIQSITKKCSEKLL
jgi:tetratricopeptide (TPR) repeat protein